MQHKYRVQVCGVKIVEAESPEEAVRLLRPQKHGLMDPKYKVLGTTNDAELEPLKSTIGLINRM
jgi:hypothetical protein